MESIRKGNDIVIEWSILRCGNPEPLEGQDLTLIIGDGYNNMMVKDYLVKGNTLTFSFLGKDQIRSGVYGLTLIINKDKEGMFTTDVCEAFRLVSDSCMICNSSDCSNTVELSSEITVPRNGLSAYEIAVLNGFKGTVDEWLASLVGPQGKPLTYADLTPEQIAELQKPATDAAGIANEAAKRADNAAKSANAVAEKTLEIGTAVSDLGAELEKKETEWTLNETNREVNEETRERNENSRIEAEKQREASETARVEAEKLREQAEKKREEDTETAIKNAEKATGDANAAAGSANESAKKANEAADNIDGKLAAKQDTLVSGENIHTINGQSIVGAGNIVLQPTIMHLPWKTNVATTRKQVPAGMRARGVKISYNNASGTYIVEQYKLDDISDEAWGDDENWKGCRTPMTPLFESAGALFNDETGCYELNGYVDIHEQEILYTYQVTFIKPILGGTDLQINYVNVIQRPVRTNFPLNYVVQYGVVYFRCWFSTIRVLNIAPLSSKKPEEVEVPWNGVFDCYSSSLEKVIGIIKFNGNNYGIQDRLLDNLVSIKFKNISKSLNFQGMKNLDSESVRYAVENSTNKTPINFTVHSTMYAKLTDINNTEWYSIYELATEKQITFITL